MPVRRAHLHECAPFAAGSAPSTPGTRSSRCRNPLVTYSSLAASVVEPSQALPRRRQWAFAPLVELVLKPQALLVRLDGADRLHDGIDPRLHLELAELARGDGAFAGIVIREPRIPPDPGVQTGRQFHACLIGA